MDPDRTFIRSATTVSPVLCQVLSVNGTQRVAEVVVKDDLARPVNERGWKGRGLWVTTFLPKPTRCQEVRFTCTRSGGQNRSPLIYEFEILGR